MHRALAALKELKEGNHRFQSGESAANYRISPERRAELLDGQAPSAVILGCADSRVPAEIVFDRGLGDLFVIRVAGNIVAPSGIGSVEYAVDQLGTRLVVVMGHSFCGAVQATIDELKQPAENRSPNLDAIVRRISPAVEPLLKTDLVNDPDSLVCQAVRANVRSSVDHLKHGSSIIENWIQAEELLVVGAEYSLRTGKVDFFEGIPEGS